MSRALTTALDANQVRKDFEIAMIFGIDSVPSGIGCLMRRGNGVYTHADIEAAWRGYLACASHKHAMLERFASDRFIGNGDRTSVRAILTEHYADCHSSDDESIDNLIRAILKHFGGMSA